MAITSVTTQAQLSVVEAVPMSLSDAPSPSVTHSITDQFGTLNASTTPPASTVASDSLTLSGGTLTIDLTSCMGPVVNGQACPVNFTGKKLNCIKIKANPNNTQPIVIVGGASNGYLLFGASGSVTLGPGDVLLLNTNASLPAVSSTAKTITITSSMSAAQFDCIFVGG